MAATVFSLDRLASHRMLLTFAQNAKVVPANKTSWRQQQAFFAKGSLTKSVFSNHTLTTCCHGDCRDQACASRHKISLKKVSNEADLVRGVLVWSLQNDSHVHCAAAVEMNCYTLHSFQEPFEASQACCMGRGHIVHKRHLHEAQIQRRAQR